MAYDQEKIVVISIAVMKNIPENYSILKDDFYFPLIHLVFYRDVYIHLVLHNKKKLCHESRKLNM